MRERKTAKGVQREWELGTGKQLGGKKVPSVVGRNRKREGVGKGKEYEKGRNRKREGIGKGKE